MKKVFYLIVLQILSTSTLFAEDLTAMTTNSSDTEVDEKNESTIESIETNLDDYYQSDVIVEGESYTIETDSTGWITTSEPYDCTEWYKTTTEQKRECKVLKTKITKTEESNKLFLSSMDIESKEQEFLITETAALVPISTNLTINSSVLRVDENLNIIWNSSDADSCSLLGNEIELSSILSGSLDKTVTEDMVGNYEVKLICTTPAETKEIVENVTIKPRLPIVVLNLVSETITFKDETIGWTSEYAVRCDADFLYGDDDGLEGSRTVSWSAQGTTDYSVTCYNSIGESVRDTKEITITPAPTNLEFEVDKNEVFVGQPISVTWETSGMKRCNLSFIEGISNDKIGSQEVILNASGDHTLSISCVDSLGKTHEDSEIITVTKGTLSLEFNPPVSGSINVPIELTWTSVAAVRCDADFLVGDDNGISGSTTITYSTTGEKHVEVTCYDFENDSISFGGIIDITRLNPTVSLTGPAQVYALDPFVLTWTSTNADNCNVDFTVTSLDGVSGSHELNESLAGEKIYSIECSSSTGETAQTQKTVTILERDQPNVYILAPNEATINESIEVSWNSEKAITCDADFVDGNDNGLSNTTYLMYSTTGKKLLEVSCTSKSNDITTAWKEITINPEPVYNPPSITMTAPTSVYVNENFNISWNSTESSDCNASFVAGTSNGTNKTILLSNPTAGTTRYTVTCSGIGGTTTEYKDVVIKSYPKPSLIFTAPIEVYTGEDFNVSWTSTNADNCDASFISGTTNGTKTSVTLNVSETGNYPYTVTCTGLGGSATSTKQITFSNYPKPEVTVTAPETAYVGEYFKISWNSSGADTCDSKFVSGTSDGLSREVNIKHNTLEDVKYEVLCANKGGTNVGSKTVSIITRPIVETPPPPPPPAPLATVNLTGPKVVTAGEYFTLYWSSKNAVRCDSSFVSGTSDGLSKSIKKKESARGVKSYTVACYNKDGKRAAKTITITIEQGSIFTQLYGPSGNRAEVGYSFKISWKTKSNAYSCGHGNQYYFSGFHRGLKNFSMKIIAIKQYGKGNNSVYNYYVTCKDTEGNIHRENINVNVYCNGICKSTSPGLRRSWPSKRII